MCVPFLVIVGVLIIGYSIIRHSIELYSKNQFNMVVLTDREFGEQLPTINTLKSVKKELFLLIFQFCCLIIVLVTICVG